MTGSRLEVVTQDPYDATAACVEEYLVNVSDPTQAKAVLTSELGLAAEVRVSVTSSEVAGLDFNNAGVRKGGYIALGAKATTKSFWK